MDILTSGFLQYVRVCLLKRYNICMDGNNVKRDEENGKLCCGLYSCPAAEVGCYAQVGSAMATAIARYTVNWFVNVAERKKSI